MADLDELRRQFVAIDGPEDQAAFLKQWHFSTEGLDQHPTAQTLTVAETHLAGHAVRLVHRWYDPSGPFQNLPDINKLRLEVDGAVFAETQYSD